MNQLKIIESQLGQPHPLKKRKEYLFVDLQVLVVYNHDGTLWYMTIVTFLFLQWDSRFMLMDLIREELKWFHFSFIKNKRIISILVSFHGFKNKINKSTVQKTPPQALASCLIKGGQKKTLASYASGHLEIKSDEFIPNDKYSTLWMFPNNLTI